MLPSRLSLFVIARGIMVLGLLLSASPGQAIEEPTYQRIIEDGDYSLRSYSSRLVASILVEGSLFHASSTGFRRLAAYIYGDNHPSVGKPSDTRASSGAESKTKIAMTAPVTTYREGTQWTVAFNIPVGYTLASLPTPSDQRITLARIPEQTIAVIRFSGWVSEPRIAAKTELLRKWMTLQGLSADGDARLARYDPPWTLPFLRRNEILIACHKHDG
jgi:hypothetical protein